MEMKFFANAFAYVTSDSESVVEFRFNVPDLETAKDGKVKVTGEQVADRASVTMPTWLVRDLCEKILGTLNAAREKKEEGADKVAK